MQQQGSSMLVILVGATACLLVQHGVSQSSAASLQLCGKSIEQLRYKR